MKKLFKNKKVVIMGLGLHGGGVGVARFFYKEGADILVTDLKTKKQLKESLSKIKGLPIKYVLGRHREKDFINADLIIKNPAVPRDSDFLKIARINNISIETDIAIFFKLCKVPIIGVTGTKGKSTVATLIYKLLKTKYPNVILAGNIGLSPLEVLSRIKKNSRVVLELSSFELEDLKKSPNTAVITEIYSDHLDRYKNFGDYIEAKKIIFKYQKPKDSLVLNYDNPGTRDLSKDCSSRAYFYSRRFIPENKQIEKFSCFLKKENIFYDGEKKPICSIKDFKLYGEHNISNILAAASVAKIFKVSSENIKKIILKFRGVPSRQEFIKEVRGVKYFNDTTATMPQATIAALQVFSERFPKSEIILIAGGQDKNLNYKETAKEIQKKASCLVLLPGTASDKLKKELESLPKKDLKIVLVKSMAEALKKSSDVAKKEGIVLLSPAAASFTPYHFLEKKNGRKKFRKNGAGFNLFKNEFDRGKQFIKLVKKLNDK